MGSSDGDAPIPLASNVYRAIWVNSPYRNNENFEGLRLFFSAENDEMRRDLDFISSFD